MEEKVIGFILKILKEKLDVVRGIAARAHCPDHLVHVSRIDIVVIYKIDRLTRSLADFAKIVEVLDKAGASGVVIGAARGSNDWGCGAVNPMRAAEAGLVAFAWQVVEQNDHLLALPAVPCQPSGDGEPHDRERHVSEGALESHYYRSLS